LMTTRTFSECNGNGRGMISLPVDRTSLSREHVNCPIEKDKFRLPGSYKRYYVVAVSIRYPTPSQTKYWIDVEHPDGAAHAWGDAARVDVGMLLEIGGFVHSFIHHIRRFYQVVAKTDKILALKRTKKGEVPICIKCGQRHLGVIPKILELNNGERVYLRRGIRKRVAGVNQWVYRKRYGKVIYTRAPWTNHVNKRGYQGFTIVKSWNENGGQELEMLILSMGIVFLLPCISSTRLRSRLLERGFTEDEINRKAAQAGNLLRVVNVKHQR